ncbi:MAG: hypothetical protein H6631_13760 [Anaerolineaceae bacterium]|nr:hypothetical protein [Anaerolineaceae bacterium]MCB9098210.1 hypothetical protein [Anaerolineales bacterium]
MSSEQDHQQVTARLEQALKQWHREGESLALDEILPFLTRQTKADWSGSLPPLDRQVVNQLLFDLLEDLAAQDADAATLLRRRYIDDETGFAVANSLGLSESAFYRQRRDALAALTTIALTHEAQACSQLIARLEDRLDTPSYQQLFGLDELRIRLGQLLCARSDIRLFCLTGIGGIGKTSLADALARQVITDGCFEEVAWVSARQQWFAPWGEIQETGRPALTRQDLLVALNQQLSDAPGPPRPADELLAALKGRLRSRSHLIILDNLETVADYQEILPLLYELSQWAWILLTSRVAIHEQPYVHLTNLTELSSTDAEALIRDEARRRGMTDLAEAPPEVIDQIYDIAGGNPLALKLIIGQVHLRSLSTILTDFKEARGQKIEALYQFIYHQAWQLLNDTARQVLVAMPLVTAPGVTLEHLAGISEVPYDALNQALDRLIQLSLVQVGGPLDERRFYIHRLTETFLHQQVTKWTHRL